MGKAWREAVADPNPTVYVTNDPLRKAPEPAVVLGRYWQLAGDLQMTAYRAASGAGLPEGAVG